MFGTCFLDFFNADGSPCKMLIFVGENGTGKSKILNTIDGLTNDYLFAVMHTENNGRGTEIEIYIDPSDRALIKGLNQSIDVDNVESVVVDIENNRKIKFNCHDKTVIEYNLDDHKELEEIANLFVFIYLNSDEFNEPPQMRLGRDKHFRDASSWELKKEILKKIKNLQINDDLELAAWAKSNIGAIIEEIKVDSSIKKFKKSINSFLTSKSYFGLYKKYSHSSDEFYFEESDDKIDLDSLSSGEKNIILRTAFILENIGIKTLLIDEPENGMHPIWQINILKYYLELSSNTDNQIFVSTHSPYVFKDYVKKDAKIFLFNRNELNKIEITDISSNGWGIFPWSPSWGEINYFSYNLPTTEFHDELYGFIQEKTSKYYEANLDDYLDSEGIKKIKKWTPEKNGILETEKDVSLQTFIRNKIHHPENITMQTKNYSDSEFRQSISEMIELLKRIS